MTPTPSRARPMGETADTQHQQEQMGSTEKSGTQTAASPNQLREPEPKGEGPMPATHTHACINLNGPRVGDRFVECEANPGAWDEMTEEITRVVGPSDSGLGWWWVEWVSPAIRDVPAVFVEQYGASFGEARTHRSVVEYRHGRWRRPTRAEDGE